jgi:hypothetical protein
MDPDANLNTQRTLAARIIKRCEEGDAHNPAVTVDAEQLAELVQALDEWIGKGGFLPKAWRK